MQERTVLLLFLDGVTGVDTTKFKIHSDLEMHLSRYPKTNKNRDATGSVIAEEGGDFEFAYFWNDDDEQWVVGTADQPQVTPPEDGPLYSRPRRAALDLEAERTDLVRPASYSTTCSPTPAPQSSHILTLDGAIGIPRLHRHLQLAYSCSMGLFTGTAAVGRDGTCTPRRPPRGSRTTGSAACSTSPPARRTPSTRRPAPAPGRPGRRRACMGCR